MEAYVRTLAETVSICLLPNDTVCATKVKVAAACELDVDCFALLWEGEMLTDSEVLADRGIVSGDTLDAVLTDKQDALLELRERGVEASFTALGAAVSAHDEDLARLIIRAGVDVNQMGNVLYWSGLARRTIWEFCNTKEKSSLASRLGADPNLLHDGLHPLAALVNAEGLLEVGADPNVTIAGVPFIIHAQKYEHPRIFEELLPLYVKHGGRVDARDPSSGFTAFYYSCYKRRSLRVALKLFTDYNATAEVVSGGGRTPLHLAARVGDPRLVGLILDRGIAPNIEDRFGLTPLHLTVQGQCIDAAKILLDKGADVNKQCKVLGQTPAHRAAASGLVKMLCYLHEKGADLTLRDKEGRTPLHLACQRGQWKVVAQLTLRCGVDPTEQLGSDNILHIAVENKRRVLASFLAWRFGLLLSDSRTSCEDKTRMKTRRNRHHKMKTYLSKARL